MFPGTGFSPAGIGAFIGGYLAREVLPAVSSTGAIGGQIGGTLGTILATAAVTTAAEVAVIGSVATAIGAIVGATAGTILNLALPVAGAFIGTIIGTAIGNAIGGDDNGRGQSFASLALGGSAFVDGGTFGDDADFTRSTAGTRDAIMHTVNAFLATIGGQIANDGSITLEVNFNDLSNQPPRTDYSVTFYGAPVGGVAPVVDSFSNYRVPAKLTASIANDFVDLAVTGILKRIDLSGANLYVKRALANTQATTVEELAGELKIAEDYSRYLAHKDVIDEIIGEAANDDAARQPGVGATCAA